MASTALMPTSARQAKEMLITGERAKSSLVRLRKKADEFASTIVEGMEVFGGALIMGGIHGRFGDVAPAGIPISLATGLGLHALAFAGIGGRNAKHLHGLGNGSLAAYGTTLGIGIGTKMRQRAGVRGMAGDVPGGQNSGGGTLTDAEMNRMADSV
jgi:hypothetical protein